MYILTTYMQYIHIDLYSTDVAEEAQKHKAEKCDESEVATCLAVFAGVAGSDVCRSSCRGLTCVEVDVVKRHSKHAWKQLVRHCKYRQARNITHCNCIMYQLELLQH